jgi:choline-glycine betaine transporter
MTNPGEAIAHWKVGAKYVLEGGRSLILINGAAAIGILTFIGNNHPPVVSSGLISALTWFAWGALAGVVLFVTAYLAQLQYGNRALGKPCAHVMATTFHWLGYIAAACSISLFLWASIQPSWASPSN